jgi:hypothetical protein
MGTFQSGGSLPVSDDTAIAKNSIDITKQVKIDASGVSDATTRVITMADAAIDLTPDTGSFVSATHATNHKSGGSDAIKLDELASPTDVTTLNVSTSVHGLCPKLPNTNYAFLSGLGVWRNPSLTKSGFSCGGFTGARVATTDKTIFSTDTTAAATISDIVTSRSESACLSDTITKGYLLGGLVVAYTNNTEKISFSTEIYAAQTSANLSTSRGRCFFFSQGSVKGYTIGGYTASVVTTADKTTYSSDATAAVTTANMPVGHYWGGNVSRETIAGYCLGGATGSAKNSALSYKVTYSNDTIAAATTANISQERKYMSGVSGDTTKGYVSGGDTGINNTVATGDKITYSNDTTAATTTANLSTVRTRQACVSEGVSKGYNIGGWSGAYVATSDKVTYATDTNAAATTANASSSRGSLPGLSNCAV